MMRFFTALIALLFISFHVGFGKSKDKPIEVESPNRSVKIQFLLKEGRPFYKILYQTKILIKDNRLGFILKEQPALDNDFKIASSTKSEADETWSQPWGEVKNIRNHYNGVAINLEEQTGLKRKLTLMFRVYDDGIGFRYEVPEQPNLKDFVILDELTEFSLNQDFSCWWIPAYGTEMDSEYLYKKTKLSEIKEKVSTPLTLESNDNLFVSIHEAALVDYAGMALAVQPDFSLKCDLV